MGPDAQYDLITAAMPSYELRYDRALVHRAVRTYVRQKLIGRQPGLWVAQAVLAVLASVLAVVGSQGVAALLAGIAVLPILLVLVGWAVHDRHKMRGLRAMGEPVAWLSLTSDGLLIRSGAGMTQLCFPSIIDTIERPRFWLLCIGVNRFVVLPTAAFPVPALDRLRAHIAEASRDR